MINLCMFRQVVQVAEWGQYNQVRFPRFLVNIFHVGTYQDCGE